MKVTLELDEFKFVTTTWGGGSVRWLVVDIDGKLFNVRRELTDLHWYRESARLIEEVDRMLIQEMQFMIAQIFKDRAAAIPDGTELMAVHS